MRRAAERLLVVLVGLLAALLAGLAMSWPAAAHVGGGAAGSDFDARVLDVTPQVPGLAVRVLQFGDELEVVNRTGSEVVVPGYDDEPYLRIGPEGVWRNANSPATYINLDRFAQVDLPDNARRGAEPDWVQVSAEPSYVWHDHRTHWMSADVLPPVVAADPGRAHPVVEWTVPLVHDGVDVAVRGELTWSPPPSPWLFGPVCAVLALLAAASGVLARGPRPLGALLPVGGAVALWHAAATPEPPVSVSSHAGAVVSALVPALAAVVVAGLGLRAARRGRGAMAGLSAVVLGWLLLVQGLPDVDVLWTANVASGGPQALGRVAVILLLALGAGLVVGGIAAARRFRETVTPPGATTGGPVPVG